ncbi:hypothetical protein J0A67_02800 [Algoriphagus aestuariicola]|uniref:Uncharacterized protein n=1 Tax=Algoriphagus aestuariicola TaxID=1852016 RepID=A0ABS3BQ23_9BACT|nr:hypothetical protein [Algoriphagus aestuariicola]MBN7799769.1 hypothetical protein [Algoriphagus aestuariicola]
MNPISFLVLAFLSSDPSMQKSIDPAQLKFGDLPFHSHKTLIWEVLGKTTETPVYYECGFFSEDEQGMAFYELRYPDAIWIGNGTDGYYLNKLNFDAQGKIILHYQNFSFSGKTSQKELENFFDQKSSPIRTSETKELEWTGLPFENRDDGCHFYFERGKLVKFEYWTSC